MRMSLRGPAERNHLHNANARLKVRRIDANSLSLINLLLVLIIIMTILIKIIDILSKIMKLLYMICFCRMNVQLKAPE
jgi:hypothetical protein